jgi:hypothetical protein
VAITAAQWKRAVLPLLAEPASWEFRNKLAYRQPVGWVLLGVLGEGSGWHRDQLYVWSLVMPLYIESEHLVLSYSQRVAPAETFGTADQAAFAAAIASAVAALPPEDEALRTIAAGGSEAAAGARILLQGSDAGAQTESLMAVRHKTAAALGVA